MINIKDFNHESWCDCVNNISDSCNCIVGYPLEKIAELEALLVESISASATHLLVLQYCKEMAILMGEKDTSGIDLQTHKVKQFLSKPEVKALLEKEDK